MEIDEKERMETARNLFLEGYNCAQSVMMAFSDVFGMDRKMAARISAPLGGGVGRMREVCGAVCGMSICAGLIRPCDDPDNKKKAATYALVQQMAAQFREANGSIVCRELLGAAAKSATLSPIPEQRTEAYYHKRRCVDLVGDAALIVARTLKEEQSRD